MASFAAGAGIGAAAEYMLDSEQGKRRRHMARDRATAMLRRDPGLEAKVESELFRPAGAPKDSVSVNVENGVVFLRGEVESEERIEELVGETRAIDGVEQVESLLHVPGEPAPRRS